MGAILIGILAAFFFSITFILNHAMSNDGGSWLFSASLRFIFMFPFLLIMVIGKHKTRHHVVLLLIKQHFFSWLLWCSILFVFFYVFLFFLLYFIFILFIFLYWYISILCCFFIIIF